MTIYSARKADPRKLVSRSSTNKYRVVRSTDAIFASYSSVSFLSRRYILTGEFTETLCGNALRNPCSNPGKTVRDVKILGESARLVRRSIERALEEKSQRIRPPGNRSLAPFPGRTERTRRNLIPRTHFAPRTQLSDTARRDTRSALARVGITIGRNKCVYVIGRASKGASSLVTPLPAATETTRPRPTSVLTCTCVLNAHTRRPGIDRAAGKSASSAAPGRHAPRRHRGARGIRTTPSNFSRFLAHVQCQGTIGDAAGSMMCIPRSLRSPPEFREREHPPAIAKSSWYQKRGTKSAFQVREYESG